jgi:hypothetical protein
MVPGDDRGSTLIVRNRIRILFRGPGQIERGGAEMRESTLVNDDGVSGV